MHTNPRTERHIVTAALAGVCALGALSAAVPLIATVLLAALIGAGGAGIGFAIHAWRTTRIPKQMPADNPPPRHLERV